MPLTIETALRKDRTMPTAANLQHRHFAWIAATIAEMPRAYKGAVAMHFAIACGKTNPKFDRARFMRACGVEE